MNLLQDYSQKGVQQFLINQSEKAVLVNGYYEVRGFKFSKYYYERLWATGRGAPTFAAEAILKDATKVIPDVVNGSKGFYRYFWDRWEMVYNPITKEVYHIQPIK
jgi:filamentous hemagglutinin